MEDPMKEEKQALKGNRATTIRNCARCGQEHELEFTVLEGDPIETVEGDYTHWAMCPVTNQPLMMIRNAMLVDRGLLDLFKEVARGDIEVSRLLSKVMKRRVRTVEIPEQIGDLDQPMQVVGYETMGERLAFILMGNGDSLKLFLDTKTFKDVLVRAKASSDEGMRELLAVLPDDEQEHLEAPKTVREILLDLVDATSSVLYKLDDMKNPIVVGTMDEPVEATSFAKCEKDSVLEFRVGGHFLTITVDNDSLTKVVLDHIKR